ncbi:hypothetical protein ScPMuIL_006359 [Solemya velum]
MMAHIAQSNFGFRPKSSMDNRLHPKTDFVLEVEKSPKMSPENSEEMMLLYIDVSRMSRTVQFLSCVALTFFFYLIYGYFLELIFRLDGIQPFGWAVTLVQFFYYGIFGMLELQTKKDKTRKIPLKTYFFIAFLTVATMGLSNTSVAYLNYPTQVIFKCCKLIPVLIGGIFIQGKKYTFIDVTAVLCMCIGLVLFSLADSLLYPEFTPYGILLVSLALCADGVIGNVQEKTLKQYSSSNSEMVLYSYGIGFVYILVGTIVTGELFQAYQFFRQHPMKTYGYIIILSISGYLGVNIVLTMVKSFGALLAVTVTTCRKAVTIILSFIFFSKPFTVQYIWSGVIVVLGIYLNLYSKNRKSWDAKILNYFSFFVNLLPFSMDRKRGGRIDSFNV